MNPFQHAEWIFADTEMCDDLYTEYIDHIPSSNLPTKLYISADSDYTVWINGSYVASNQYGDFEHYKIYDTIEIGEYLCNGKNRLDITLYYCGTSTQRYRRANAGLLYEVWQGECPVAYSGTHTLSRKSPTYQSGVCRLVSRQLGYTFSYDATARCDGGYTPSRTVQKCVNLVARPIPKQTVLERAPIQSITRTDSGSYLIDLGRELVGLATLDFTSSTVQTLRVAYGESLTNGHVRAEIHDRHFFFEYKASEGNNSFTDYMLRLGCRYLEVSSPSPIEIHYIGILPQIYSVERLPYRLEDPTEQQIYDASVSTLCLCMMEHYVDTPWREQCLYAFDSRNQMLSGYTAFPDGNREYARASLALMGEDKRPDGLLSICAPSGTSLAIPSFSLYYVIAMQEYAHYTGDLSLARTYQAKLVGILDEFLARRDADGLIRSFDGEDNWNFYDWSEHLNGKLAPAVPDLLLQCLVILALDAYHSLCEMAGLPFPYGDTAQALRECAHNAFISDDGVFSVLPNERIYTALGNALAILSGVAQVDERERICEKICSGALSPSSLSMSVWIYDALLLTDAEKYSDYVRLHIRDTYSEMTATTGTVWETARGSDDFDGAGSLCHGWSAIPVYIYDKLSLLKKGDEK